jgi:hypothetical protein
MRPELQHFIEGDETEINTKGWMPYLEQLESFDPTKEERHEIGQLLLTSDDHDTVAIAAGVMMMTKHSVFRPYLFRCLDGADSYRKSRCMEALIRWADAEAIDLLCRRPDIQEACGDRLPERIEPLAAKGFLSQEQDAALLRLATERLRRTKELDYGSDSWVDLLVRLRATSHEVAQELVRIWGNEPRQAYMYKFTLLLAMVAHPLPEYEPVFRKATKSKVEDIHDLATRGLTALQKAN